MDVATGCDATQLQISENISRVVLGSQLKFIDAPKNYHEKFFSGGVKMHPLGVKHLN